jgi:hypothetical protein
MPSSSYLRLSASLTRSPAALCCALCALACGTAQHTEVPPVAETNADAGTSVSSAVNVCPFFRDSRLLPQRVPSGQSASIVVHATDPDAPDSLLSFRWDATSGTFSPDDEPVTNYRCSKVGAEQLNVTVTDQQGCSAGLTLGVECLAK